MWVWPRPCPRVVGAGAGCGASRRGNPGHALARGCASAASPGWPRRERERGGQGCRQRSSAGGRGLQAPGDQLQSGRTSRDRGGTSLDAAQSSWKAPPAYLTPTPPLALHLQPGLTSPRSSPQVAAAAAKPRRRVRPSLR